MQHDPGMSLHKAALPIRLLQMSCRKDDVSDLHNYILICMLPDRKDRNTSFHAVGIAILPTVGNTNWFKSSHSPLTGG